jgi:hypothetical protein
VYIALTRLKLNGSVAKALAEPRSGWQNAPTRQGVGAFSV